MDYQIFNEDCLEGMKRIETGSVDAIICDPPYGVTCAPFDKALPFSTMWGNFSRVLKKMVRPFYFASNRLRPN